MKVLLVEDDTALVLATGRVLRAGGYDVLTARDAVSAVAVAVAEGPDVVLLDIGLPAGGGVVVLQRLRARADTSLTPVLVITGGTTDEQRASLERLGVEAFLTKPVPGEALLVAVAAALGDLGPDAR